MPLLQFVLGMIVGGFITLGVIALISINKFDDSVNVPAPQGNELGDNGITNE